MKIHTIIASLLLTVPSLGYCQFYDVHDLTPENSFTNNIEGPNTNKQGELFVVNFQQDGTIGKVEGTGAVSRFVTLPEGSVANAIVFDRKGNLLLADWKGHNVLKVTPDTRLVSVFCHNDDFNQPNDLCINRKGQLFASDPNWKDGTGKVWRIDPNAEATLLVDSMGTTNGIALSPNQKLLYVNESVQRKIWSFEIDRKGTISHKKLFASFDDFGLDGMKCDNAGNLYVARYGKGVIAVFSPAGLLLREVLLKGKNVSNLTFGGIDGKTCYVTVQDRKCVEVFRAEIPGRPTRNKYR